MILGAALARDHARALQSVEANADRAGREAKLAREPPLREVRLVEANQGREHREVSTPKAIAAQDRVEPGLHFGTEPKDAGYDRDR